MKLLSFKLLALLFTLLVFCSAGCGDKDDDENLPLDDVEKSCTAKVEGLLVTPQFDIVEEYDFVSNEQSIVLLDEAASNALFQATSADNSGIFIAIPRNVKEGQKYTVKGSNALFRFGDAETYSQSGNAEAFIRFTSLSKVRIRDAGKTKTVAYLEGEFEFEATSLFVIGQANVKGTFKVVDTFDYMTIE